MHWRHTDNRRDRGRAVCSHHWGLAVVPGYRRLLAVIAWKPKGMKNHDPNSWLSAFVFTGTLLLFVAGIIGAMAIHPIMLVLCVAAVWALAMLDRV